MTRDQVAKAMGFIGERDTRLRKPDVPCSHAWIKLGEDAKWNHKTVTPDGNGPYGCLNCAAFLK